LVVTVVVCVAAVAGRTDADPMAKPPARTARREIGDDSALGECFMTASLNKFAYKYTYDISIRL
jgi:hypothetical protein